MKKLLVSVLFLVLCAVTTFADTISVWGKIANLTTTVNGVMIMIRNNIESGNLVPGNVGNTAYGWLLIPEANKSMIALALIAWMNKLDIVVYTTGLMNAGFGVISQIDPDE